ncbi:hypothetical protein DID76_04180, partial [Candidatus Marinamargulisbacteria bacterium SCGC AG-414-C22]
MLVRGLHVSQQYLRTKPDTIFKVCQQSLATRSVDNTIVNHSDSSRVIECGGSTDFEKSGGIVDSLTNTFHAVSSYIQDHPSALLGAFGAFGATVVYHQYLNATHYRNEALQFRRDAFRTVAAVSDLGLPPIHGAALRNDFDSIQQLATINSGVINQPFKFKTPLHLAASCGHSQSVTMLLSLGANLLDKDKNQETPLTRAIIHGHKETVQVLLDHDKDQALDQPNSTGNSPLMIAIFSGRADIAHLLLVAGYSLQENLDGVTPLMASKYRWRKEEYGFHDLTQKLGEVTSKAEVPTFGPLCHSLYADDELGVKRLLAAGESPIKSRFGICPLSVAARAGSIRYLEWMRPYVNVEQLASHYSNKLSPLHLAAANTSNPDVISYLVNDYKFPVDISSRSKNSPLHSATRMKSPRIVNQLLRLGACSNVRDIYGQTPLHWAARNNDAASAELLLKNNALLTIPHYE